MGTDAELTLHPRALYASSHDAGKVVAPELRVTYFERRDIIVDPKLVAIQTSPLKERSFVVHDAVASVAANVTGFTGLFTGLYPTNEGTMTLRPIGPSQISPRVGGTVPEDRSAVDVPEKPFYVQTVTGPHYGFQMHGGISYVGPGALKVMGSDVTIAARENVSQFSTGERPSTVDVSRSWIYLEWTSGQFDLEASDSVQIAGDNSTSFTTSAVAFRPTGGSMTSSDATYTVDSTPATVSGALRGQLVTIEGGMSAVQLDGDLAATSFHAVPVPPVPSAWRSGPVLAVGLFAVGVVLGAALIVRKQQRAAPPRGSAISAWVRELAEDYARRATEAAEEENFREAAELMERAGNIDPSDPYHPLHQGIYLIHLRRPAEAIMALDRAAKLMRDGEPEWWAAEAALIMGNEELAEGYVLRALDRDTSAWVIVEIERSPRLAGLRSLPSVQDALSAAHARLR
jgi:hypothetical protein